MILRVVLLLVCSCVLRGLADLPDQSNQSELSFKQNGNEFSFNTGVLKGCLRKNGSSYGVSPVVDIKSEKQIAAPLGLLTPYRLLDAKRRYLPDARGWKSHANLLQDGAVKVHWKADKKHPFNLTIVYRWMEANVLDSIVTVNAKKTLPNFEVFMTCYFAEFDLCYGSGKKGLVGADRKHGTWLCFPRDDKARKIISDGRWKHPPSAVDWVPIENYKYPLCLRANLESGLTGVMMAKPDECFAVLMPYHEEKHYSLYCSLFGYDIKEGKSATAVCRVVLGKDLSEKDAIEAYKNFVKKD